MNTQDKIDDWKCATGLMGACGDPSTVEPADLERELAVLRAVAAQHMFRWIPLHRASNSGKTLFVCRCCGRTSYAPDKDCPQPEGGWGAHKEPMECRDWEPLSLG